MKFGDISESEPITERERMLLAEALHIMRSRDLTWGGGGRSVTWSDMFASVAASAYRAQRKATIEFDTNALRESECLDAVGNMLLSIFLHRDDVVPILQGHPRTKGRRNGK